MQLKRLVFASAGLVVAVAVFYSGYIAGKNRTVKRELNVSIPFHVQIYRSIKEGDSNRVATLTGMVLMGKIDRFDSLKNDPFFRITAGSFDSTNLQKYVGEGRNIIRAERTNLVTIGSERK